MENAVETGAGSGLGRELCIQLAQRKYRILLADVNMAGAQETLEFVKKVGGDGEIGDIMSIVMTKGKSFNHVDC